MSIQSIESLREGHSAIIEIFDQLQSATRSYREAKPKIREMNQRISMHLVRQDKEMFEKLNSFHCSDQKATKMIEFLIHDLKSIRVKSFMFFEEHSGEMGDTGARTFPKDFNEFFQEIMTRLRIEEEYLFPLIKKLSGQ